MVQSQAKTPLANTPLSDVTVLDFGQIFQGPYASFLLAKAGAFVIKIEPPRGEPGRRRAEPGKSATLPFAMLNQNKHAVTLNLKHERGRALLFEMAERADVLLENFSPGTMDDLGVGWSRLHERNPRLIYASGTGFGISGPDQVRQLAPVEHFAGLTHLVAHLGTLNSGEKGGVTPKLFPLPLGEGMIVTLRAFQAHAQE